MTNAAGVYSLAELPIGTYVVTVEAEGFKTAVTQNVVLNVGATRELNAQLEIGAVTEAVTVTSSAVIVETIGGEVAGVGDQVTGVKIGDKVVAYPWIGCGQCSTCQRGDENLCNNNSGKVLGVNAPGGFADYVILPHPKYLLNYEGISAGMAATDLGSGLTAYSALKKI